MKKILCVALSLCLTGMGYAQVEEQTDNALFKNAIEFFDAGNIDQAVEIFNGLLKRNPKNPDVKYELALCYYSKGDYKNALSVLKKLKKECPNPRVYAMCGNCLDDMGKTKDAMAIYDEGIKLFPDYGQLHLEKGMIYLKAKEYDAAYSCFKDGVNAEPSFSSNHFRIAQLNLGSQQPFFGLLCGEVHSLLSPGSERTSLVSGWMYDAFQSNVKLDGDSVKVLISNTMNFDIFAPNALENMAQLATSALYYTYFTDAATGCYEALKNNGKLSLMDVVEFRRRILEKSGKIVKCENENDSVEIDDGLAGLSEDEIDSVVVEDVTVSDEKLDGENTPFSKPLAYLNNNLITYQKKILDAGHWEAYNMWLFRKGNDEEFQAWIEKNEDKFDAFVDWFNNSANAFSVEEEYGK